MFDVIIVGASVAGATAAKLLGEAGLRVAIFDKSEFPRRKPCGEGLSGGAVKLLREYGIWNAQEVPHHPYYGYHLHAGDTSKVVTFRGAGGVTVRREELDLMILNQALRAAGVTPFIGRRVDSVDAEGAVRCSDREYKARYILLADGGSGKLLTTQNSTRLRKRRLLSGTSAGFVGTYNIAQNLVHIQIREGCEIYATPLPQGRLNVAVLTPLASGLNPRHLLLNARFQREIFEKMSFRGELELVPMGRAPIGSIQHQPSIGRVFMIGDSVEQFDPIGGMGMTHAVISAALAAKTIIRIERGECSYETGKRDYARLRNRASRPLRHFTKLTGSSLRLAGRYPSILSVAASPWGTAIARNFYPVGELV